MYRLRMHAVLLCLAFLTSTAVLAQAGEGPRKNEIGLVIGATETPGIEKTSGGTIDLNSSLVLGAEYDRQLLGKRTTLYVGADFLACIIRERGASDVLVGVGSPQTLMEARGCCWVVVGRHFRNR